ncbi:hypothetical protein BSKO_02583 [Bryopsis sp. KO-2023]|nr:hypothetical protein BSKO_02583 [Bryopsis sp. KO-2023]
MPGSSEHLAHSTQQGIRSDFDTDARDRGITSSESHDAECAELERLLTSPSTARVCRSEGGLSEEVEKLKAELESLQEDLKKIEHKIKERTDTLSNACQTDVSELTFEFQTLRSRVSILKMQNELKKHEICEAKLRADAERVKRVSDILKTLCLKKGRGVDPILKASILGEPLIVELLIWFGSDVNATDASSYTPLHWATRQGHLEVVKLLLDKGLLRRNSNSWENRK